MQTADLTPETATPLRAIETEYRGYRFRSRTEARWAVFLDAAGIVWQYEAEGFNVGGVRYLPDFFLPELKTYVEVKPTRGAAEQAAPLLLKLAAASGCHGVFAVGSPTVGSPDQLLVGRADFHGRVVLDRADIQQCRFCAGVGFWWRDRWGRDRRPSEMPQCACSGAVRVLRAPHHPRPRITHALAEAQRARFEFGETGEPHSYTPPPAPSGRVYMAGPVVQTEVCENIDDDGEAHPCTYLGVIPWREEIFGQGKHSALQAGCGAAGRFLYAGPTVEAQHGMAEPELARRCLKEALAASLLFCWIDRKDTIGTLVEIGAAHTTGTPIFVAFANENLAEHFYFAEQLATVAVVSADVKAAWDLFTRWQAAP